MAEEWIHNHSLSIDMVSRLRDYGDLMTDQGIERGVLGAGESSRVLERHLLDSLACLPFISVSRPKIVDVGSGGGLPGIPVAIALPESSVSLLETRRRRCDFLREVVEELRLDAEVVCERAEVFGRTSGRERYDVALSRALASAPVVLEYCLPLVRVGGRVLALRSPPEDHETRAAEAAAGLLGGAKPRWEEPPKRWVGQLRSLFPEVQPTLAPDTVVLLVEKREATDPRFPRRAGVPSKRPLR